MGDYEEDRLISNYEPFSEDYIPFQLIGRDKEIKELFMCLSPAFKGQKPINAWIYGVPGTGKTVTCKYVSRKIENEMHVKCIYINCWEYPSFFSVLDKIVRELRIFGAEKLSGSFKFERLQLHINKKPLILFLDEIDQAPKKEREKILYNFSTTSNLGIVAICNNKYPLYGLDERIKSRLNAHWIEFAPYSPEVLTDILQRRADFSLRVKSCSPSILKHIVQLAENDARIAIQTLKNAAYLAEKQAASAITKSHVIAGYNSAKHLKITYLLNGLTPHHRILYNIVKSHPNIMSGNLWLLYQNRCKKQSISPIALRTFSEYMNKLIDVGLVKSERATVRGKVRRFAIAS